ncbi:hypothetical protein Y1Q_0003988 [Alligator mississippiensis]|uniref:Uncharacterized protein n=1 Tax=Alligator mississippiensis TaxID=8496 RepID=A0A151PHL0_ALLMI|nr:hypothetical protein Y1Q_0003988 [Alligator mississippiensis]
MLPHPPAKGSTSTCHAFVVTNYLFRGIISLSYAAKIAPDWNTELTREPKKPQEQRLGNSKLMLDLPMWATDKDLSKTN